MAVRKIKNSWWVDFRFNRVRYRKRSPENSRAGAQAYEVLLRQKLARGETLDELKENKEKEQTFEEFAWKWFEIYVKSNNKLSEIKSKQYILKTHLVPHFGETKISEITNLMIEKYKAEKIGKELSNQTINNHLNVLSKCLRTAQEWLDLEKLPKIKKLKVPPQKFDFLSVEESELLLSHAEGIWYEMILVGLKTGLRLGELRALDWSDINWNGDVVLTVRHSLVRNVMSAPKSNKERHIPLTNELCKVVSKRRRERGLVFADKKSQPFKEKKLYKGMCDICEKAGLRKITWHVLRHTFASHLAMAGAYMKAIQELMGHADMKTTLRYAHLSPSAIKDAIGLLDAGGRETNFGQPVVNRCLKFTNIFNPASTGDSELLCNIKEKQELELLVNRKSG